MLWVGWKDWDMVYCLTYDCNNRSTYMFKGITGGYDKYPMPDCYIPIKQVNGLC